MYVLALSDYKQPAAAAGYKPAPQLAPQLGRQTAVYSCFVMEAYLFCIYTTSPSYVTRYVRRTYLLLLLLFGSLVNEVHELVELRRNDDLCAAVALFAHG